MCVYYVQHVHNNKEEHARPTRATPFCYSRPDARPARSSACGCGLKMGTSHHITSYRILAYPLVTCRRIMSCEALTPPACRAWDESQPTEGRQAEGPAGQRTQSFSGPSGLRQHGSSEFELERAGPKERGSSIFQTYTVVDQLLAANNFVIDHEHTLAIADATAEAISDPIVDAKANAIAYAMADATTAIARDITTNVLALADAMAPLLINSVRAQHASTCIGHSHLGSTCSGHHTSARHASTCIGHSHRTTYW